jgi:hypothetical protein
MPHGPHHWMDIEPNQPRLAINYAMLETLFWDENSTSPLPATNQGAKSGDSEKYNMEEMVDQQANELELLRAELRALKKQIRNQGTAHA